MSQWKCFNCKMDMEEVDDIKITYKDLELPDASGFRCPGCGTLLRVPKGKGKIKIVCRKCGNSFIKHT